MKKRRLTLAMALVAIVMAAWYLFASWNESTKKFSLV